MLDRMQKDINSATAAYYAYVEFNNALCNPDVKRAADKAPSFWQTTKYSLQTTAILALARIFDSDSQTYSVNWLFSECFKHQSDLYCKPAEIQLLKDKLKPATKIYADKIKPIRNKIIAHSERLTAEQIVAEFKYLSHGEWQTVCSDLNSIITALRLAHTESIEITGEDYPNNIEELMRANVERVTSAISYA